jgi:uncharacterized membrane protein YfcA
MAQDMDNPSNSRESLESNQEVASENLPRKRNRNLGTTSIAATLGVFLGTQIFLPNNTRHWVLTVVLGLFVILMGVSALIGRHKRMKRANRQKRRGLICEL